MMSKRFIVVFFALVASVYAMQPERERVGALYIDGIGDYFPEQVELGLPMLQRFIHLVESGSPFLDRAKVYNQLLVDMAFLTEDGLRLGRCAHYLKATGTVVGILGETIAIQSMENRLDGLYRMYGRLFVVQDEAGLVDFDRVAAALSAELGLVKEALSEKREALQHAARSTGQDWSIPPTLKAKSIVIAPDGKPNQIVFATQSPGSHYELEKPLTIGEVQSVKMWSLPEGEGELYGFQALLNHWGGKRVMGATQASIATAFAIHDKQVTPAWFRRKYAADPDILMVAADGARVRTSDSGWPLNTWRPEVRDMAIDLVTQLGSTFRAMPQFLWYVTSSENTGPYFRVDGDSGSGVRSTGYNVSALSDFHSWLRERYETIESLNRQWRMHYKVFESIAPPEDLCLVGEWKQPHPLAYEFQSWREDHHVGWLKLIYDTLKAADPTKPVFASHSRLLALVDGSRLFETADIIGYHYTHHQFMLGSVYIHSLNRFAKKQLGQYENWWGAQEDLYRISDERVQRRAMMRYLYRLTVWGRHVQVWWYAYTTGDYLLRYNSNWFNPVYDLTTLRYSAAALPVGKAKVKRLESVFLNSEIVQSRIVMIQPTTSMLFEDGDSSRGLLSMITMHDLLFSDNLLYELIPENYFVDDRADLSDFDVVILPYAPFFPDLLDQQLDKWVGDGGFLATIGPFGIYDKFGFDVSGLWVNVFEEKPTRLSGSVDWRWALDRWKNPDWLDVAYGKGRVVTSLRSLRNKAYRGIIGPELMLLIRAGAPPLVSASTGDFELTLHPGEGNQWYLCVLNRNVDRVVEGEISLREEFIQGVDLDVDGGFPVVFRHEDGNTLFDLRLAPGEFTVLALGERK